MALITLDINELPARYAEVLCCFHPGDSIVVTRGGSPVFQLVPTTMPPTTPGPSAQRILGMNRGTTTIGPDFNDPLPKEFWSGETK